MSGADGGCPTCSHTMHAMGCKVSSDTFYWCPRCGTIMPCTGEVTVPMLVTRCREYEKTMTASSVYSRNWHTIGIRESINRPEGRGT
jgi:hypothetical protein